MKIRILVVALVGFVAVSSVLAAQDVRPTQPAPVVESGAPIVARAVVPTPNRSRQIVTPGEYAGETEFGATTVATSGRKALDTGPKELHIFELEHAETREMAAMVQSVLGIAAWTDGRLNRLIVNVTEEQREKIRNLIVQMDVPSPEASGLANLIYRIYMFEVPLVSETRGMKPFLMTIQTPINVDTTGLLGASQDGEVQIGGFHLSDDKKGTATIVIEGTAASQEALRRVVLGSFDTTLRQDPNVLAEYQIRELRWDDETVAENVAGAQFEQLSEPLQKHIERYLGSDVRTVGYWFGNVSAPGTLNAPIGPYELMMTIKADESGQKLDLRLSVERILANTVTVKPDKPVIIGYNRQSFGKRRMGALVIVPDK